MNISQAIKQIEAAVRASIAKDENGAPLIPVSSQRPILLYGPPGVGKTAIVRQAADALGIGFLSYTMTHHTRQSALGLPQIVKRTYNDREFSVTEYTMSEIIQDVYETAAQPGGAHGILFLDEINCVSETLMPAMLELLQFKRFGKHALPEGWIIVCAGNPEMYNRSAHSFDPVTMDRVRLINIESDTNSWLEYASARNTDPIILSYIRLRPDELSVFTPEGAVTPRSWSDLSAAIHAANTLGIDPDKALFEQYLQYATVCDSFALYYALCRNAQADLNIEEILRGEYTASAQGLLRATFDESVFLATFLARAVNEICREHAANTAAMESITHFLAGVRAQGDPDLTSVCRVRMEQMERAFRIRVDAGVLNADDTAKESGFLRLLHNALCTNDPVSFLEAERQRLKEVTEPGEIYVRSAVQNSIEFADRYFASGSLRIVFVTAVRSYPLITSRLRVSPLNAWTDLLRAADMSARENELRSRLDSRSNSR